MRKIEFSLLVDGRVISKREDVNDLDNYTGPDTKTPILSTDKKAEYIIDMLQITNPLHKEFIERAEICYPDKNYTITLKIEKEE